MSPPKHTPQSLRAISLTRTRRGCEGAIPKLGQSELDAHAADVRPGDTLKEQDHWRTSKILQKPRYATEESQKQERAQKDRKAREVQKRREWEQQYQAKKEGKRSREILERQQEQMSADHKHQQELQLERLARLQTAEAEFQGQWIDEEGSAVCFEGRRLRLSDGVIVELAIESEDRISYQLDGCMRSGEVVSAGRLLWNGVDIWTQTAKTGSAKSSMKTKDGHGDDESQDVEPMAADGEDRVPNEEGSQPVDAPADGADGASADSGGVDRPMGEAVQGRGGNSIGGSSSSEDHELLEGLPPGRGHGSGSPGGGEDPLLGEIQGMVGRDPPERGRQKMSQIQWGAPWPRYFWSVSGMPWVRSQFGDPPTYNWTPWGYPGEGKDGSKLSDMLIADVQEAFKARDPTTFHNALVRLHDVESFRNPAERDALFESDLWNIINPLLESSRDRAAAVEFLARVLPETRQVLALPNHGHPNRPRLPVLGTVLQVPSYCEQWEHDWDKPFCHPGQLFGAHQATKQYIA
mmetsp:Transcript_72036/g.166869  ORF Transcript_72036/g.166869 Transcript_72036/m.166869 type:complete len:521 (-) Transcript_72036:71-1633(-)|eukprot:CAMPEP_0171102304 /NCGR_PEP_ID=MMETSP0766_2-20121228/57435_1 /TAXON_ID=439317 /ORGANISM="Gambierdiscus australes, Strain CAWD 149" /LENGTH=520 /DNA_ID=CAMNT_0011562553 /DNA_START=111 /DNA_END=1673 /DNA_ORIENTATION=+